MNDNFEKFLNELKNNLSSRLCSVFAYGSKASAGLGNCENIDLMIVVDNLSPDDLMRVSHASREWMRKNPMPVFMDKREWFASADVYALEYSDIKEYGKILYGEDVISPVSINRDDLRFQCEHELKNLLMRLRKNYLLNSCNDRMLKEAFIPVIKTVLTLARAILRLKNYEVPAAHCELLEKLKELSIVDSSVFSKLLDYKEGSLKISRREVLSLYPDLLVSVGELLKYVNDL